MRRYLAFVLGLVLSLGCGDGKVRERYKENYVVDTDNNQLYDTLIIRERERVRWMQKEEIKNIGDEIKKLPKEMSEQEAREYVEKQRLEGIVIFR